MPGKVVLPTRVSTGTVTDRANGRTATAPGRDHGWEPEAMAALLVDFARDTYRAPASQAAEGTE